VIQYNQLALFSHDVLHSPSGPRYDRTGV
jgi:hypothetical protein